MNKEAAKTPRAPSKPKTIHLGVLGVLAVSCLFVAQRIDRIQRRCLTRWIVAKEDPHGG